MNLEYFRRGYAAVELLIDRIMNPQTVYETRLVPTTLLVRQSCGCFEKSIIDSGVSFSKSMPTIDQNSSEEEVRAYLLTKVREIFPQRSDSEIVELIDSIFFDIYEQSDPSATLRWFQNLLQNIRKDCTLVNSEL